MTAETRRRRQREAIIAVEASGDHARAIALLVEHLNEFPQDLAFITPALDRGTDRD